MKLMLNKEHKNMANVIVWSVYKVSSRNIKKKTKNLWDSVNIITSLDANNQSTNHQNQNYNSKKSIITLNWKSSKKKKFLKSQYTQNTI